MDHTEQPQVDNSDENRRQIMASIDEPRRIMPAILTLREAATELAPMLEDPTIQALLVGKKDRNDHPLLERGQIILSLLSSKGQLGREGIHTVNKTKIHVMPQDAKNFALTFSRAMSDEIENLTLASATATDDSTALITKLERARDLATRVMGQLFRPEHSRTLGA